MTSFACPPPAQHTLPLTALVHPGFGSAVVYCESQSRYRALPDDATVQDAEDYALTHDARRDWRLSIDGPLSSATYQRQGAGVWVLIDRSEGFA
jgi:hypothetical protein